MTENSATISSVQHHTAEINGARLHYVSAGADGSPVLLVHGFPETWWAFRGVIPLLAERHRVIAVDLRGFGDSATADDSYSSQVAAEDLFALITHLDVGPMHVVGQDLSGSLVYRLAANHPEVVASLTAVESGLAGFGADRLADVTRGGAWYIGALAAAGIPELLFAPAAEAFIGHLYASYRVQSASVSAQDVTEFARSYGRRDGFAGAAGLYRSMLSEGEELRALAQTAPLSMPVTAIGAFGGGFTRAAFAAVSSSDVTAIQLDGIGHYVAQEAPDVLAAALTETFARVAS
ncbi:alpha/beta hydrolase [soil metagenome]